MTHNHPLLVWDLETSGIYTSLALLLETQLYHCTKLLQIHFKTAYAHI